ncbi:MAG: hypothetical protein V7L14_12060 [Nostoc sp.]|uniref:hypothetical protein n=1 Tax=Nostoc sp. TaxID=1180 RepID=UPI002FFC5D4D
MPAPGGYAIALLTSVIAPATNEAIAYSIQKVMILSSDSSSLMLFFPLRIKGDAEGGTKSDHRNQITLVATLLFLLSPNGW